MEGKLFALQRLTAMILLPLVLVHLVGILYAIEGGLSAAEILGRTQSTWLWPAFYAVFVVAAAIHGSIGLRNILIEWGKFARARANAISGGFAVLLLVLGMRAVVAIA